MTEEKTKRDYVWSYIQTFVGDKAYRVLIDYEDGATHYELIPHKPLKVDVDAIVERGRRRNAAVGESAVLRDALTELVSVMGLVEQTPIKSLRDFDAVKDLGRKLGFGVVMKQSELAWRDALEPMGFGGGEFVAGPCRSTVANALAKARQALGASND